MGRRAVTAVEEERMRKEILAVAQRLFVTQGVEAVTLRSVAKGVGCSPMWLYRFFPNKRAILRNIWESVFVTVFEQIIPHVEACPDPVSKLRTFADEYITYWLDHPDEYRVLFLNEDAVTEVGEEYYVYDSDTLARFALVEHIIEDGMREEFFLPGDAELAAQQVVCLTQGVAHMLIMAPEYPWVDHDRIVKGSLQMMLRGLGASLESSVTVSEKLGGVRA